MKLTINSFLKLLVVVFVVSSLYLVISLLGFIDLGYLKNQGNPLLFIVSGAISLGSLCLMIAFLVLKLLRKVKK